MSRTYVKAFVSEQPSSSDGHSSGLVQLPTVRVVHEVPVEQYCYRLWVGRVGSLVGDRNAEVRRAACQALHLVFTRMDGPTLLTHIAHASPPDQVCPCKP